MGSWLDVIIDGQGRSTFRKHDLTGDFCLGGLGCDPLPDLYSGGREVAAVLHEKTKIVQENWRRSERQEGGGGTDTTGTLRGSRSS